MSDFIWNTVVGYLILFMLLSFSLSIYIKDKSYTFYALYNLFLALYVFTKNDWFYTFMGDRFGIDFNNENVLSVQHYFNWYIQVVFYSLYFMFAICFLDFDKLLVRSYKRIRSILLLLFSISTLFLVFCIGYGNHAWFRVYFVYVFVPFMIGLFIYALPKALKHSNKHKYFLLMGIVCYITFALIALIQSIIALKAHNEETNSIQYFLLGIIAEGIFFSIGLAYKMKLINDERIKSKNAIVEERHKREISNLKALIDGEEKERTRLAQDLHDGINGDLSSIKYQLSSLVPSDTATKSIFDKTIEMIDSTCQQVRNISHNLSPMSIRDFGLITSIGNYCLKLESIHPIDITFQHFGKELSLPKNIETIIYRIIQELVNNIIKHAAATEALVQVNTHEDTIFITVEDNGKGFENGKNDSGIGLNNIMSRLSFLNAQMEKEHHEQGTTFHITIELNKIPNA